SYLTIEHRGEMPAELQPKVGAQVYGCDICQEVCPWNAAAPASADPAWQPRAVWDRPLLANLASLDDDQLRAALRKSPMKRAKVSGLRRNFEVARNNRPERVR